MSIQHGIVAKLEISDYTVMAIYMALVLGIGFWFTRGRKDTATYLLGGRSMPWWLIGISYFVSLLSTLTLVGVPGEAYTNGLTMSIGSIVMPIFSILAFHFFVRFYFRSAVFTPFDYLERRYSPLIRGLSAGFFWISRVVYIGLVLYASAKVFHGADGWPVWKTILLVGVIGVLYTVLGGLKAVVWSDFVQFVVLAGGIVLILNEALFSVPGGAPAVMSYALENGRGMPELTQSSFYSLNPYVRATLWGILAAVFNEQLFFNSSDQIAIQRLLSTSSYQQAKRSLYTFAALLIPVLGMLWFLGLVIFGYYGQVPADQRPVSGDAALFQFIATQLPAPIPGLILSAMLAAIMSTLDSGINSLATVATKDFYLRFRRPNATEDQQVAFSRWMTLGTGIIAILIGLMLTQTSERIGATVMETTMAWLTLSVALPPVYILGMISRRARPWHALVQLIVGWSVTAGMLAWYHGSQHGESGGISFMVVGVPGPVLALLIGVLLSRMETPQSDERLSGLTYWTLRQAVNGPAARNLASPPGDPTS